MRKIITTIVVIICLTLNGGFAIETSDSSATGNVYTTQNVVCSEVAIAAEFIQEPIATIYETTQPTVYETEPAIEETIYETEPIAEETIPIETIQETIPIETILEEAVPVETIPVETEPIVTEYEYGTRMTPAVEINYENGVKNYTDVVDTSEYTYYGRMFITGYTPKCAHCCGSTEGITASGVPAIPGYTVAAGYEFDFGTTLYIEGYGYYVVEDRGNLGENVLDIAAPDHESCYPITQDGVNVYIVPNKFHNQ